MSVCPLVGWCEALSFMPKNHRPTWRDIILVSVWWLSWLLILVWILTLLLYCTFQLTTLIMLLSHLIIYCPKHAPPTPVGSADFPLLQMVLGRCGSRGFSHCLIIQQALQSEHTDAFNVTCLCIYSLIYLQDNNVVRCLAVSSLQASLFCIFSLSVQTRPVSKVKVLGSSITAVSPLWLMPDYSLPSQAGPLIRVRLLCGHVHQWCEGGQAGRGEDGRGGPWCIVGPGAVCIHRYTDTLFIRKRSVNTCQTKMTYYDVVGSYIGGFLKMKLFIHDPFFQNWHLL